MSHKPKAYLSFVSIAFLSFVRDVFLCTKIDDLVKSRSNVWIPTFAGMTVFVTNCYFSFFCHSRAGGNPGKTVNSTFYDTVKFVI